MNSREGEEVYELSPGQHDLPNDASIVEAHAEYSRRTATIRFDGSRAVGDRHVSSVFYPYSGDDVMTPIHLFPEADLYILIDGLPFMEGDGGTLVLVNEWPRRFDFGAHDPTGPRVIGSMTASTLVSNIAVKRLGESAVIDFTYHGQKKTLLYISSRIRHDTDTHPSHPWIDVMDAYPPDASMFRGSGEWLALDKYLGNRVRAWMHDQAGTVIETHRTEIRGASGGSLYGGRNLGPKGLNYRVIDLGERFYGYSLTKPTTRMVRALSPR